MGLVTAFVVEPWIRTVNWRIEVLRVRIAPARMISFWGFWYFGSWFQLNPIIMLCFCLWRQISWPNLLAFISKFSKIVSISYQILLKMITSDLKKAIWVRIAILLWVFQKKNILLTATMTLILELRHVHRDQLSLTCLLFDYTLSSWLVHHVYFSCSLLPGAWSLMLNHLYPGLAEYFS